MIIEGSSESVCVGLNDNLSCQPFVPSLARVILEVCQMEEGLCVEVGSGTGELGMALAEERKGLDVILYDHSREALTAAEQTARTRQLSYVSTYAGELGCLPFENGTIDLIVSDGKVLYQEDPVQVLCEMTRVMAPGGEMFVHVPDDSGGMSNQRLSDFRRGFQAEFVAESDWGLADPRFLGINRLRAMSRGIVYEMFDTIRGRCLVARERSRG